MGREYDPYSAEVIEIVPGVKDNVVTEVIRKGYKMGDKILRVAQVKVTKKT
jgi:molecular chaperone GrpE (heat shock protein)